MLRGTLLLLLCLGPLGCGYRLLDAPGPADADAAKVEIRFFDNRSDQVGVERLFAAALAEEFSRRGTFEPVLGVGTGPALILQGQVLEVRVTPVAYSSVGLALEERVEVVLDVEMVRRPGLEEVWKNEHLELKTRFLASSDNEVYQNQKEEALRRLASGAAGRIHDELLQSF